MSSTVTPTPTPTPASTPSAGARSAAVDVGSPVARPAALDRPLVPDQRTHGGPTTGRSTVDARTGDGAAADRAAQGHAVVDRAPVDPPAVEQPVADRPVPEHPASDHPAADEPAAEVPPVDGPAVDEPALPVAPRRRRGALPRPAVRYAPAAWFLVCAALTVVAHVLAAIRPGAVVATLGETRLAVAAVVVRGAELATDPLPIGDRFAALQLAVLQTLLPLGDAAVVDAARWACLLLGAVGALLIWPVLRGLDVPAPAAALAVGLLGAGVPVVVLHAGITAAAPAAVWLTLAAALAVRQWGRTAVAAALIAAATAPLAAAALLALAAHLVVDRSIPVSPRLRRPLGVGLGAVAVAVAGLAVGDGPLAGAAGPATATPIAAAGVSCGLLVVALTWRVADWLRPVLTAAALLLVAGLVPGPSRVTAALLVAPAVALAVALLAQQLIERLDRRAVGALLAAGLLAALAAPVLPALLARPPVPDDGALVAWLTTEPGSGTVVRADDLDRAELLAAGFPAARLRPPGAAEVPGELHLRADRPSGGGAAAGPVTCDSGTAVAVARRGTGGAPGAVCRTDGAAPVVAAESASRVRLGTALADNPALTLSPAAAAALRDGAVDPRLMLVLAAMTSAHQVGVDDFPAVPLDAPAVPRRHAVLSAVDGGAPATSPLLATWLTAQQPPFVPTLVRPAGSALLVGYPAPPPSGLLPE